MAADHNTKTIDGVSFAGFNAGLFDRMRRMNRSWLERLRELHQIEVRIRGQVAAGEESG